MAVLSRESSEQVAAIEALTGSLNYATWKRLMISYLKARQREHGAVLDEVVSAVLGGWRLILERRVGAIDRLLLRLRLEVTLNLASNVNFLTRN